MLATMPVVPPRRPQQSGYTTPPAMSTRKAPIRPRHPPFAHILLLATAFVVIAPGRLCLLGMQPPPRRVSTDHAESTSKLNLPMPIHVQVNSPAPAVSPLPDMPSATTNHSAARTQNSPDPSTLPQGPQMACQRHILYDKPVKTGSTSVMYALRAYIQSTGGDNPLCGYLSCTSLARGVCNGTLHPQHITGHVRGSHGLVECLRERGYYAVTSVRPPVERWTSAFLYNRQEGGMHFGVSANESYAQFMARFPDCQLYAYYDGLSPVCELAGVSWKERLVRIASRYDEVIDLFAADGENQGRLFRGIRPYIAKENVSKRPAAQFREPFDQERLVPEEALYKELRKRMQFNPNLSRVPCHAL